MTKAIKVSKFSTALEGKLAHLNRIDCISSKCKFYSGLQVQLQRDRIIDYLMSRLSKVIGHNAKLYS